MTSMKQGQTEKGMKILAVVAVLILFIVFALPSLLFIRVVRERAAFRGPEVAPVGSTMESRSELLGELGSVCGGEKRLPCRPGLMCSEKVGTVSGGVCVQDATEGRSVSMSQYGKICHTDSVCVPGLYCPYRGLGEPNFCDKLNENAPFIVSARLDGMSPVAGHFVAVAGTKVKLLVQTTNVDKVEVWFEGKKLGVAKKEGGGVYRHEFELTSDLNGLLQVIAFQENAFSALGLALRVEE